MFQWAYELLKRSQPRPKTEVWGRSALEWASLSCRVCGGVELIQPEVSVCSPCLDEVAKKIRLDAISLKKGEYAFDDYPDGAVVSAWVPGVDRGTLLEIDGQIYRVVLIDHYLDPPGMFIAKVVVYDPT